MYRDCIDNANLSSIMLTHINICMSISIRIVYIWKIRENCMCKVQRTHYVYINMYCTKIGEDMCIIQQTHDMYIEMYCEYIEQTMYFLYNIESNYIRIYTYISICTS